MRILFRNANFPAARELLAGLLPDDEIAVYDESAPQRAEVLVPLSGRIDAAELDAVRPSLVQQYGAGLDAVDLDAARERGVPVANLPAGATGNADSVAETAVLHLLALSRRYREMQDSFAARRFGEPLGASLVGRTATIIGLGAIGSAVARRLHAFGMLLRGVARRGHDELAAELAGLPPLRYFRFSELTAALAGADVAVLCCALTEETTGILGADGMAAMRPGGYVINVGRGPLADKDALLAALRSGQVRGAGLDVFWQEPADPADELFTHNVSVTPHIGGVTEQSYGAMARAFAENVERLRRNETPHNLA